MRLASEMTVAERTAHGAAVLRQHHGNGARAEATALASWKAAPDMRAHWKRVEALLRSEDAQRDTEPPDALDATASTAGAGAVR